MYTIIEKDADENAQIDVDWSAALETDTITSSSWGVPTGLTLVGSQNTATTTRAYLDDGTLGQHYYISNSITTLAGRTTKRTFVVRIISR